MRDAIPLAKAVWCCDCDCVTASTGHRCDVCQGAGIYPIWHWIQPVASRAELIGGRAQDEIAQLEKLYKETK